MQDGRIRFQEPSVDGVGREGGGSDAEGLREVSGRATPRCICIPTIHERAGCGCPRTPEPLTHPLCSDEVGGQAGLREATQHLGVDEVKLSLIHI
eukprot:12104648-Heterocapsa_arctica.AAC.1